MARTVPLSIMSTQPSSVAQSLAPDSKGLPHPPSTPLKRLKSIKDIPKVGSWPEPDPEAKTSQVKKARLPPIARDVYNKSTVWSSSTTNSKSFNDDYISTEVYPDSLARSIFSNTLPPILKPKLKYAGEEESNSHAQSVNVRQTNFPSKQVLEMSKRKNSLPPIERNSKDNENKRKRHKAKPARKQVHKTTKGDDSTETIKPHRGLLENHLQVEGKSAVKVIRNPQGNEVPPSTKHIDATENLGRIAAGQSSGDSGVGSTFSFRSLRTALSTLTQRSNPQDYVTKELSPREQLDIEEMSTDGDYYFDDEFDCRSGKFQENNNLNTYSFHPYTLATCDQPTA